MQKPLDYKEIGFVSGKAIQNNCIYYLEQHVKNFPNRAALRWVTPEAMSSWGKTYSSNLQHTDISISDFYEKVQRTASGLKALGIKKGDCVIIFLPMSVELYQSMFAVMQIGAVSVFLDSWARRTHLGASADIVQPKAMISFEKAFGFCGDVPEISKIPTKICAFKHSGKFTASLDELAKSDRLTTLEAVEGEDTALITFTTGSSGKPKGANRTHQFLSSQHIALDATIPYTEKDCDLPAFPIFSLNNLASGVSTVIPAVDIGAPTPQDPLILATQMRSCNTSCCTLSPSMLVETAKYCIKEGIQMDFLRRVVTGGAPISNDDLRSFKSIAPNAEIWVLYGSTEVEPIAHMEAEEILKGAEGQGVKVGHFAEGLEYKFLKINKNDITWTPQTRWEDLESPSGEVGEIIVAGGHVCKGYYNDEEATARAKIRDDQGRVWHRTGDLGYQDKTGSLWIVGRVHNAIQRKDRWLFPVGAEIILKRLPFAKRVAFLGIPHKELTEKTYAIVAPNTSDMLKNQGPYLHQIKEALEREGFPVDEALLMDDVPMDPRHHSKVEYGTLREEILKLEATSLKSGAQKA